MNAQADEFVSRPLFIKEFKKHQIVKKVNDDFGVTYNQQTSRRLLSKVSTDQKEPLLGTKDIIEDDDFRLGAEQFGKGRTKNAVK